MKFLNYSPLTEIIEFRPVETTAESYITPNMLKISYDLPERGPQGEHGPLADEIGGYDPDEIWLTNTSGSFLAQYSTKVEKPYIRHLNSTFEIIARIPGRQKGSNGWEFPEDEAAHPHWKTLRAGTAVAKSNSAYILTPGQFIAWVNSAAIEAGYCESMHKYKWKKPVFPQYETFLQEQYFPEGEDGIEIYNRFLFKKLGIEYEQF